MSDSTTNRTESLDDWLEQWRIHEGWQARKAEVNVLVDEVERLRTKLGGLDQGLDRWCHYHDRLIDVLDRLGLRRRVLAELERDGWRNLPECVHKAEVGVLRGLLDHAVQSWSPRGINRAPLLAEWDDGDWGDSGWSDAESVELRAAVDRVRPDVAAPEGDDT